MRSGFALGEPDGPESVARGCVQGWHVEVVGDLDELVGGLACCRNVGGGKHDLDVGREHLHSPEAVARLGDNPGDCRLSRPRLSLSQPEQGKARLRLEPPLAGFAIGGLGGREVSTFSIDLGLPVEGGAGGVFVRGVSEPLTCLLGLLDRLRPIPMQLQDLGPVDKALAREGHHVRLCRPPRGQRGGPLLRAPQIRYLLAGVDHRAVDVAGDGGPHLAGDHRDHRLVEQRQALAQPSFPHQRATLEVQP